MGHDNVLVALSPCHADDDDYCYWPDCPQKRDGEPQKTGRHCPLDTIGDDES